MTHLQHGDYLALLRLIAEVSAAYSLEDFRKRAVTALRHLTPSGIVASGTVPTEIASNVDFLRDERARGVVEPSDDRLPEGGKKLTALDERQRLLLGLARPHLIQAQRNAALLDQMQEAMAHGAQAVVALDRAGEIAFTTRGAERLLDDYFGEDSGRGSALPEGLREWVNQERRQLAGGRDVSREASYYVVEEDGRRLIARLVPGDRESDRGLVLLTEEHDAEAADLSALGLSTREAEVLHLVARGKTDAQIAEVLVVSPRTVHKHLEHIYEKLGVRTRTAAVSRAFGHVRRGSARSQHRAA